MLRKIWILLGAVALITVAYVTAIAGTEVQQPIVADDTSGGAAEANTWTVCSSGCDFASIQAAVDAASDGDTIELGSETFYESIVMSKPVHVRGSGADHTTVIGGDAPAFRFGPCGGLDPPYPPPVLFEISHLAIEESLYGVVTTGSGSLNIHDAVIRENSVGIGECWLLGGPEWCPPNCDQLGGVSVEMRKTLIAENGGQFAAYLERANVSECTIINNNMGGLRIGFGTVSGTVIANNEDGLRILRGTVSRSTIANNGGVGLRAVGVEVENSTISGNGSGVLVNFVSLVDNTIDGNGAYGVLIEDIPPRCDVGPPCDPPSSSATLIGNIISHHEVSCSFDTNTRLHLYLNLLDDDDSECSESPTSVNNADPMLLPLADNGGSTPTHALAPGSPAIDAGGEECSPTDQRGARRPQDGDNDGEERCDIGAYEVGFLTVDVQIDIKPDGYPNSVNPNSRGVIPVAILGSDTFDVVEIDVTTLAFGPDGASPAHRNGHLEDANLDGYIDLVTHYRTRESGIACGDESATLTGETLDGQPIEGFDSIQTVGCHETRRPAIWMKDLDRRDTPRTDGPVNIERK